MFQKSSSDYLYFNYKYWFFIKITQNKFYFVSATATDLNAGV